MYKQIQIFNSGQTSIREIIRDTQPFEITFRTEEIHDYLIYPSEVLDPTHLHVINAKKAIQEYWGLDPNLKINPYEILIIDMLSMA